MHAGQTRSNHNGIEILRFARHLLLPVRVVWTSDKCDPATSAGPISATATSESDPTSMASTTLPYSRKTGQAPRRLAFNPTQPYRRPNTS
jgi:hypothetical protein